MKVRIEIITADGNIFYWVVDEKIAYDLMNNLTGDHGAPESIIL